MWTTWLRIQKLYTLPCPLDKQQFIPVKPSQYSQSTPMCGLCDGQVLCAFLLIVNAGTLLINKEVEKKSLWRGSPGPPFRILHLPAIPCQPWALTPTPPSGGSAPIQLFHLSSHYALSMCLSPFLTALSCLRSLVSKNFVLPWGNQWDHKKSSRTSQEGPFLFLI